MNRFPCRTFALVVCFATAGCKHETETHGTPPPAPPPSVASHDAAHAANGADTGAPPSAGEIEPPAAASEFVAAGQWLPRTNVGVWRQSGPVTRSSASDLFQVMDGAAVAYQRYGLRDYAKTEYRKPGTNLVTGVEIYEFESPLGAFGRYSLMLSDGRDPASMAEHMVRLGDGGFQGTTQLAFWKGRVLAVINVQDTSDEPNEAALGTEARTALPAFGAAVAALLPAGEVPISPLPLDGLVSGGQSYLANDAFGIDQTGPAWVGHYRSADGKRYRLAIFPRGAANEAQAVMAKLRGPGATAVPHLGDDAFAVHNESNGDIVAVRVGTQVYAIADSNVPGQQGLARDAKIAVLRTFLAAPHPSSAVTSAAAPNAPAAGAATDAGHRAP